MIEKEFKDNLKRLVNYEEVEVTMSFADFETEKPFNLAYKYKKGNNYVELVELKTLKQLQKLDLDQLERVLELTEEMNQPKEEKYGNAIEWIIKFAFYLYGMALSFYGLVLLLSKLIN